jgi:predicted nucleotidyltransferase
MGQVFTWQAIRQRHIPEIGNFAKAADLLRKKLGQEPAIVSALLFGSVVRGDFNTRSDIDCVVIYETESEEAALKVMQEIDVAAGSLHVPINFTPCDTVLAGTRLHCIRTSFVRHLREAIKAGGMIKGDLRRHLAPTMPAKDEIESYISAKAFSVQESLAEMRTFSMERRMAFFKKALESVTHVARKMLIYEGKLDGDSKKEVQLVYRNVMPPVLSNLFDHLLSVDEGYSIELSSQLRNPKRERYEQHLDLLESRLPDVLRFLRMNIVHIDQAR